MADAVVSFVIERVGDLLVTEAKFLYGVKGQVEDAQAKLRWMRCFLKDADAYARDGDERVRNWIVEIREAATALEDVIETFLLKVDSKRKRSLKNVLKRSACILNEGVDLHKVGSEIERISKSISSLTSALQAYGIKELTVNEGASSSIQRRRELRRAYSHVAEHDVVGLDKDIEELVGHLTGKENPHRVISICGMGGLGKTTLARKVYHHPQVRSHFDGFAWESISQQCESRDVWEGILIKLTSPSKEKREEIRRMRNDEISKELYNVQKERNCLVVLDDIWTTSTWDTLKAAFPEDEMDSKIVLTTRKTNVALHADKNVLLHQPLCLNENEGWELFVKKLFSGKDATDFEGNYERMEGLGRDMIDHCAGLPLAIIVLSGILSTKHTVHEWEMLTKNVKSYINRGNEHSEQEYRGVSSVLGLSYYELPYYLKPCFLYLASFPEDFTIKVKSLCNKLIAEGFISPNHRRSPTETIEDIAYEYLGELVDRNMIQVEKWGSTGRIKTFKIHDLMRDLCLFKSQEENFLQFVDLRNRNEVEEPLSFGMETDVVPINKVRRVAIYADTHVDDLLPFIGNRDGSLRSLAFIYRERWPRKQVLKPLFNRFQMLRLLNLEEMCMPSSSRKLPKEIGKLIHLRFLSLDGSEVQEIPSSIGNLRFLQTLNLRTIRPCIVPNVIWRLEQLRHLYLPIYPYIVSGKYLKLTNLRNLQTLYGVPTKFLDVNEFVQLTNLKKLVLNVYEDVERIYHNSTGVKFNCLRSLWLFNVGVGVMDIVPVISCYPQIYKLGLHIPIIKLPEVDQFSPNLMKLNLSETGLKEDPMRTLEKLPNLRVLVIGDDSFMGNEMVCSRGGFPLLQSLSLYNQDCQVWRIEEGALPRLRHLKIFNCHKWSTLPDGLRYVTTLMEVEIERMPLEFKTRLEEGGEDFYKVQHVPSLVFLNTESIETSTDTEDESLCL